LQTNVSDIYLSLANTYKAEGRLVDAAAVADRIVAAGPRDADMFAVAGVVYCSTGQRAKGLAAFAASLAVKPSMTAYLNRIRFLPAGALAERKRDIDGALKIDPKDADALLALANWQSETGDDTGAAATLAAMTAQNAAAAEPDIAQTIHIGTAYARAGLADKARENFAEARGYATATKDGDKFNSLCYGAAVANFDLTAALADCNRAVALEPKDRAVLDSLGFVQLRLGHFGDAIAAYDKALAIDPQVAHSLYGRGIAHLRQGDQSNGRADIAAATKIDANIADTFTAMGVTP
jgi:tetratricopeptide (TPR) repeat protein